MAFSSFRPTSNTEETIHVGSQRLLQTAVLFTKSAYYQNMIKVHCGQVSNTIYELTQYTC